METATENIIEERFPVGPRPQLTVSNVSGQISVRAGADSEIVMRATKHGSMRATENTYIDRGQSGNRVNIQTKSRREHERGMFNFGRNLGSVDYDIEVPRSCEVRVKAVSADVRIDGTGAPVGVRTVSGNIVVKDVSGESDITAVSGDVECRDVTGDLTLRTTSGDATVTGGQLRRFNLNTVSGDFTIETPLAVGEHYFAKTVSGDLQLIVPPDTAATVTMRTLSGDVQSELPADIIKMGRRNWQGRINGGGANVEMHSVSGDLRIVQGSAAGTAPARPSQPPAPPPAPEPPAGQSDAGQTHGGTMEVLSALERGEISVEEAMSRLDAMNER